jgi:HAD superfamily hydrolase (TIGR01662 family)
VVRRKAAGVQCFGEDWRLEAARAMPAPVRAILFDLGDTLIHWDQVDRKALFRQAAARTYRLWATRQCRMPDFRRYYLHQWFAMHWGHLKQVLLRREISAVRYLNRVHRKLWLWAPAEFLDEVLWEWYRPLAELSRLEPRTHEVLATLTASGYRLGIVSNTFVPGHVLDRHLQELDLLRFFPQRVYSCDTGYRKPSRRIFQQALRELGAGPGESVFVGDRWRQDVLGARRAGLTAVWKRPRHAPTPPGYPWIVRQLHELPQLLQRFAAPGPEIAPR